MMMPKNRHHHHGHDHDGVLLPTSPTHKEMEAVENDDIKNDKAEIDTTHCKEEEEEEDDDENEMNDDDDDDAASDSPSTAQSEASFAVLLRYMGLSSRRYGGKPPKQQKQAMVAAPKSSVRDETTTTKKKRNMSSTTTTTTKTHDLQVGDHVIRWKMIGYCYPMQVHGIVFSVKPDCVTIVDCGLSSSYSSKDRMGNNITNNNDEREDKRTNNGKTNSNRTERRRMNILTLVDIKEIKQWTKIRYGEEVELKVHSSNAALRSKSRDRRNSSSSQTDIGPSDAEIEESSSAGLELEEECLCDQAKIRKSPEKRVVMANKNNICEGGTAAWVCSWQNRRLVSSKPKEFEEDIIVGDDEDDEEEGEMDEVKPSTTVEEETSSSSSPPASKKTKNLRLPDADPPMLVLARLRFLLEYGEEPFPPLPPRLDVDNNTMMSDENDDENDNGIDRPTHEQRRKVKHSQSSTNNPLPLLPPHHLLYANSECIAVFCKTGRWSTLQASIFLHTSTFGNAKQTATVAMFLSSQTVTIPASGFWGWFGGTTTVSLFAAQPWLVPALVGGGMIYIGLPMLMLWKAKSRWAETEKRLNDAFWSMYDSDVTVEMIRCWGGLDG